MSCHNLKTDPKEMGTSTSWNWWLTVPRTTKMMLVRPLMANLKIAMLFLHVIYPSDSVYKSSHPLLVVGKVHLWTDIHHHPTWPVYWLLSGEQKDPPHSFSNTSTRMKSCAASTPPKGFQGGEQKWSTVCSGKTGRTGLQIVRYFQELIWWAQFLHLLIFRKALNSFMVTFAPHN